MYTYMQTMYVSSERLERSVIRYTIRTNVAHNAPSKRGPKNQGCGNTIPSRYTRLGLARTLDWPAGSLGHDSIFGDIRVIA